MLLRDHDIAVARCDMGIAHRPVASPEFLKKRLDVAQRCSSDIAAIRRKFLDRLRLFWCVAARFAAHAANGATTLGDPAESITPRQDHGESTPAHRNTERSQVTDHMFDGRPARA
jgi:hypothetical protein